MLSLLEKEEISNNSAAVSSFEAELIRCFYPLSRKRASIELSASVCKSIDHVKGGNVKVHLHIRARIPSGKR